MALPLLKPEQPWVGAGSRYQAGEHVKWVPRMGACTGGAQAGSVRCGPPGEEQRGPPGEERVYRQPYGALLLWRAPGSFPAR